MVVFSLLISVFFSCLKSTIAEDKIYVKQQQWFYSVSLGSCFDVIGELHSQNLFAQLQIFLRH